MYSECSQLVVKFKPLLRSSPALVINEKPDQGLWNGLRMKDYGILTTKYGLKVNCVLNRDQEEGGR